MDAAAFGHKDIVQFLLDNKADPQLGVVGAGRTQSGVRGSLAGQPSHCDLTWLRRRSPGCAASPPPLGLACPYPTRYLSCCPPHHAQNGDLPAHRAARFGHTGVLQMLEHLPSGRDALAAANADGKTPLMLACCMQEGGTEAAQFLIEQGSDIAAADKVGAKLAG
jgi:ankyrin repeat protein